MRGDGGRRGSEGPEAKRFEGKQRLLRRGRVEEMEEEGEEDIETGARKEKRLC